MNMNLPPSAKQPIGRVLHLGQIFGIFISGLLLFSQSFSEMRTNWYIYIIVPVGTFVNKKLYHLDFLFFDVILQKQFHEGLVIVLLFKRLLTILFQPSVEVLVPVVEIHMNLVFQPHPAAPLFREFPVGTAVYMVFIKAALATGEIAFFLITLQQAA